MAQTDGIESAERSSEEIRQDIFEKLESLSKTVDQLGSRIHETFDWREQVGRHPYIALGAAAGLGFLLSGLFKPAPSPGERIMDAIGETVENLGSTLQGSVKEGLHHKPAGPNLVRMISTIAIQAGVDLLLARIGKEKAEYDMPTNGRHAHKSSVPPTQAKRVF